MKISALQGEFSPQARPDKVLRIPVFWDAARPVWVGANTVALQAVMVDELLRRPAKKGMFSNVTAQTVALIPRSGQWKSCAKIGNVHPKRLGMSRHLPAMQEVFIHLPSLA